MAIDILGYGLFLVMGLTLGLVGAGGSILTIPILIYVFKTPVLLSTTYSLFIVGSSAFFGMLRYKDSIVFNKAFIFAVPSIISISFTRFFIVPHLPQLIFGYERDTFLMSLLVLSMFTASYLMITSPKLHIAQKPMQLLDVLKVIVIAAVLGVMLGVLGSGGGFLIVPTLILLLGMEMKNAVATSLFVITLNSLMGFVADPHHFTFDLYKSLLIFTTFSMFGMWVGTTVNPKIPATILRSGFGWFIATIATFILFKEWM